LAVYGASVNSLLWDFSGNVYLPNLTSQGCIGTDSAGKFQAGSGCSGSVTGSSLTNHKIVTGAGSSAVQIENNPQLQDASTPAAITQGYSNDTSTGTSNGLIAKLNGNNQVVKVGTSDTEAIGIVVSGGATSGTAQVATLGSAACTFDNTATDGHYVQISTGTAGDCHDAGSTLPTSGGTLIGRVIDGGAAGSHNVAIALTPPASSGSTGISGATNNGAMYATGATTGTSTGAMTDGQLLIGDSTGAPQAANLTAGTNVTITNNHHGITIAASSGASGMTKLCTGTISSSTATLLFDNSNNCSGAHPFTSTYNSYLMRCWAVIPVSSSAVNLLLRVGLNGTYDSTTNHYGYSWLQSTNGFSSASSAASTSVQLGTSLKSTAGTGQFTIWFDDPLTTTYNRGIQFHQTSFPASDAGYYTTEGGGAYLTTTAYNDVELFFSSGNISNATCTIWGLP
jgi:hypothetical protein